jgi:hypothetical protein
MNRRTACAAAALASAAIGVATGTNVALGAPRGLAACASVPARYHGSPTAMFFVSACTLGEMKGVAAIARTYHFRGADPAGVARQYVTWTIAADQKNAALWARIQQVGVSNFKRALYDGMLAGFRAHGRP